MPARCPLRCREIADRCVESRSLRGRTAEELQERLAGAGGPSQRLGLVDGFLVSRLRKRARALAESVARYLRRRAGMAGMGETARHLGLTRRGLQRACRAGLGILPKAVAGLPTGSRPPPG